LQNLGACRAKHDKLPGALQFIPPAGTVKYMLFIKKEEDPDSFWREYEEKTNEKVLARSLGRYISGWDEFDENRFSGIWGLVITTSGGFRFHHFSQMSWIDALTRFAAEKQPTEKTFFIPNEKIISTKLIKEKRWWKRIISAVPPQLIVLYTDEAGGEKRLLLEVEYNADDQPIESFPEKT
jgi:hypothetical protein